MFGKADPRLRFSTEDPYYFSSPPLPKVSGLSMIPTTVYKGGVLFFVRSTFGSMTLISSFLGWAIAEMLYWLSENIKINDELDVDIPIVPATAVERLPEALRRKAARPCYCSISLPHNLSQ